MSVHQSYMQRCLELAQLGLGNAQPNPLVGSVIVYNDTIIGEGYHQQYGAEHAEVNAINSVEDKTLLKKSTLYVNLEPCSHYGKTPPCADLIIKHEIPHVVIGAIDEYSAVNGKGVKKLEAAGVKVELKILEAEAKALNKRFYTFYAKKRPYIILKWAQTMDSYMDIDRSKAEKPLKITNALADKLVHKWRSEEQSILVGTTTAIMDNPQLSVRNWEGKSPLRIIIDKNLKLSDDFNLLDKSIPTIVINFLKDEQNENMSFVKINEQNFLSELLNVLFEKGIQSLIVEGGSFTINQFIKADLWDEARVFISKQVIHTGVKVPNFPGELSVETEVGDNRLLIFLR